MILFELFENENDPIYQELATANGIRQYDFLRSLVIAAGKANKSFLSQQILKALNYQAIVCLHTNPGEFRPCEVSVGNHNPPAYYRVQALMDDMINVVNVSWKAADPLILASFVLWRLNYIHPFINGNGRTARAACYFIICAHLEAWLPGDVILPELLKRERARYVLALRHADSTYLAGQLDLAPLFHLIAELLAEQVQGAQAAAQQASEQPQPPQSADPIFLPGPSPTPLDDQASQQDNGAPQIPPELGDPGDGNATPGQ